MNKLEVNVSFCGMTSGSQKQVSNAAFACRTSRPRSLLTLLLPLLCGAFLNAETLGHVSVATNYLWRGVTQTDDKPAVSAALEYCDGQGNHVGVWASNTDFGDRPSCEIDIYLGHRFDLKEFTVNVGGRNYYFPSGGKYNHDFRPYKWEERESSSFAEFQINAAYAGWNAGYAYSNNYLDSGKNGYYIGLDYTRPLTDELLLTLHFGEQKSGAIDDTPEQRVGDRTVTLKWGSVFLAASNLTDNADGRQSDRIRYVLGWNAVVGE